MNKPTINPAMWLNNVRAVPTVGVRFQATFDTSSSLVQRLKAMLTKWQKVAPLKIGLANDNSVKVERQDGVEITIGNNRVVCKYFYISEIIEKGRLEPVIKFHTARRPLEEVVVQLQEVLLETYTELCRDGNRIIEFAGIVAEGNLDPEGLPPGFTRFIDHIGKPWALGMPEVSGRFLAAIEESPLIIDRCHHMIDFNASGENVVEFKLDWQRVWKDPQETNPARLATDLDKCRADAMTYFGRFGLGDLQYAN